MSRKIETIRGPLTLVVFWSFICAFSPAALYAQGAGRRVALKLIGALRIQSHVGPDPGKIQLGPEGLSTPVALKPAADQAQKTVLPAVVRLTGANPEGLSRPASAGPGTSPNIFQASTGIFKGIFKNARKPAQGPPAGLDAEKEKLKEDLPVVYDGENDRVPEGESAAPAVSADSPAPGYWDSRPSLLESIKSLEEIGFKDPLLALAAKQAGRFYDEARENPPKGRLGGRKEVFTQRDLQKAWLSSFHNDYAALKPLIDPRLAVLIAFYRATEFSYGAGLDYDSLDENDNGAGDYKAYQPILLGALADLAKGLALPGLEGDKTPGTFVDRLSQEIAGISLEDIFTKARAVPLKADKTFENALGPSGAILRSTDEMSRHLVMETGEGEMIKRIAGLWRLLTHLKHAVRLNMPVGLVGPTGTAKSTAIKWLAAASGIKQLSVAMRPSIGGEEMIGSIRPLPKGLAWQWGFLIKAVVNGDWVTLEEFNLSPSEVLEFLNEFLNSGFARLTQYLDEETLAAVLPSPLYENLKSKGFVLTPHQHFRIFMTMNPDFYSGRNKLAQTLMNRLVQIWVPDYSDKETARIQPIKTIKTYQTASGNDGFKWPTGGFTDSEGRVCIMDAWNHRVQIFPSLNEFGSAERKRLKEAEKFLAPRSDQAGGKEPPPGPRLTPSEIFKVTWEASLGNAGEKGGSR